MAHTVSGASLEGIYNRLNGIEQHHPLEADTFADWSVEAGDVVTISRDGKSYQSPIHTSTMKWQGKAPMVSVASTGNEKREPISKVSRQKYSRGGGGGYRSNRWFYNEIWSEDGYLHSVLSQTESNFHVYVEDTYAQLRSGLELTSSSARLYAGSADNAAQIVARINASTGESEIQLDASKVYIGNTRSTTVINGKLNASDLTTERITALLANATVVNVQRLNANTITFVPPGASGAVGVQTALMDVQITGPTNNVYKLQYKKFYHSEWQDAGSFSRATTLSGVWSGTVAAGKQYKVTASPQGTIHWGPALDGMSTRYDKTWASDKKSFTQTLYVYDTNGDELYEENKTFSTTDSYEQGYSDGAASVSHSIDIPTNQIYTTSGSPRGTELKALKNKFIAAQADGDHVCFRVDCGGTQKWYYMTP